MDPIQHSSVQPYLYPFEDAIRQFQGSAKRPDDSSPGLFADILAKLTRAYVGPQWRTLNYLWDKYETGLRHSREGKLNSAEQIFAEAAIARSQFSDTSLHRLIDVAALPAVAYLRYKQASYDEAETLLIASINSDATLLSEGFYILEYHRVQQLHNLARLYFRQGLLEKGARMIATALQFVAYGHTPLVGSGGGWSVENSQRIPAQLCSDMFFQLTNETIGLFLAHPTRNRELCQIAFAHLTFWEPRTRDEAILLEFLTLKEQYETGPFDKFVLDSIPFLTQHPVLFDYCKLSVLMDIVEGGRHYGGYTTAVNQAIYSFMDKLKVSSKQREICSLFFHQLLGNEVEAGLSQEPNGPYDN